MLRPSHRLFPRSRLLLTEVPAQTDFTRPTDLQLRSTDRRDPQDHRLGEVEFLLLMQCRFRRCWTRTVLSSPPSRSTRRWGVTMRRCLTRSVDDLYSALFCKSLSLSVAAAPEPDEACSNGGLQPEPAESATATWSGSPCWDGRSPASRSSRSPRPAWWWWRSLPSRLQLWTWRSPQAWILRRPWSSSGQVRTRGTRRSWWSRGSWRSTWRTWRTWWTWWTST